MGETGSYCNDQKSAKRLVLDLARNCAAGAGKAAWNMTKTAVSVGVIVAVAVPFVIAVPFCMHHGDVTYY